MHETEFAITEGFAAGDEASKRRRMEQIVDDYLCVQLAAGDGGKSHCAFEIPVAEE